MKPKGKQTARKVMAEAEIKKLFNSISQGRPTIDVDQLFDFFEKDLGMQGDDPFFGYLITIIMEVHKIEVTTYDNFAALFHKTKAGGIKDLREIIQQRQLHSELDKPDVYKTMYQRLFELYTNKFITLDFDTAKSLWAVYLRGKTPYYEQFMKFLEATEKIVIHRDQWNMVFQFCREVKNIETDYRDSDGWVVFLDKFVEFVRSNS